MKSTYLPLLLACAVFAAQTAMAQGTFQFVQRSNTGAEVSGTFAFESTSPMPPNGFTLTAFSLSWLGGINFGTISTSNPLATFASLPTCSGGSLSGTLDATMRLGGGVTARFLGNFGPANASIDLTGVWRDDHVAGAITYVIPEPSTLSCAALGLAGLFVWRQYHRMFASRHHSTDESQPFRSLSIRIR